MNLLSLYHKVDHENRKSILDLIEVDAKAKIIDLGCSDGEFALKIAEKAGTDEIYGAEFLEEALLLAKARGIKVYWADLNENLPFENESFDVAHANQVLEHLPETDRFIKEVYRILSLAGMLLSPHPTWPVSTTYFL